MRWRFLLGIVLCAWICSLIACGGSSTPQAVQVTLSDDKIASSMTTFAQNTPYHFVITNKGVQQHEFMIMPPMMGMNSSMEQMDKTALAHIASINPGETRTLDYTFTQAAPQGKLEFACHISNHYQQGMHVGISVQ